jgi:hypothetical protein
MTGRGLFAAYDPKTPTTKRSASGGSRSTGTSGSLAATGSSPALPWLGGGVVGLGLLLLLLRRRLARGHTAS